MLDAVLAILAGLTFAVGVLLNRKSLSSQNFFSSMIVMTSVGNAVLWPILLVLKPSEPFNTYGLMLLALAGFLHPGLSRLLYFKGMLKVGVAINASIFATYPLFTALLAIPLFNEQLTIVNWFGIVSVVAGTVLIQGTIKNKTATNGLKRGLLIPIIASLISALGYALKKIGLNAYGEPLVGTAAGYLIALILYALMFALSSRIRSQTSIDSQAFKMFWGPGVCISIGYLFVFYALWYGNVSLVTSLVQTEPLFILLFTYIYFRKVETLSKRLALGTILVVLGIVLITAFKS